MTPAFAIRAEGADITALVADRLLSLRITDQDGLKSDRLEVSLDDRDDRLELPEPGARLEVALGFRGQALTSMGSFVVDRVAGQGRGVADDRRHGRRHGLVDPRPENAGLGGRDARADGGPDRRRGGARSGRLCRHGADPAALHRPDERERPAPPHPHRPRQRRHRQTRGRAPGGGPPRREPGGRDGRPGARAAPELALGAGRARDLCLRHGRVAGARERRAAQRHGGRRDAPQKRLRHAYATEVEARRAAQSHLDAAARGELRIVVDVAGFEPRLFGGGLADLPDLREGLTGRWFVTQVDHALGGELVTRFAAQKTRPEPAE